MRTAEEYFELAKENVPDVCTLTIIHKEMIRLAQKESYNQAIDDAFISAKIIPEIDEMDDMGRWYTIPAHIDENSILKLKKK